MNRKINRFRIPFHYLLGAGLVLLFAVIYDQFSHGVHSAYMDAAFLIPVFGAVLSFLLGGRRMAGAARVALLAGILTLTTGSIVQGIFLIAGTASPYMLFYPAAGFLFIAGAVICGLKTAQHS